MRQGITISPARARRGPMLPSEREAVQVDVASEAHVPARLAALAQSLGMTDREAGTAALLRGIGSLERDAAEQARQAAERDAYYRSLGPASDGSLSAELAELPDPHAEPSLDSAELG